MIRNRLPLPARNTEWKKMEIKTTHKAKQDEPETKKSTERNNQSNWLSSKTYVFEDKITKY